jgi:NAD(P)-dependent dehydrogenase (short-subunit alcohol dehydrogenase family)
MDLGLQGKAAVLTGAGKGMGPAIVDALAREGANMVLGGRDLCALEDIAAAARARGVRVACVACDVTQPEDADRLVAAAIADYGAVDILVNVAGGTGPIGAPAWETSPAAFDEIVKLNLSGCFYTMRAAMPHMISRRYGKIVNVGGTFGMRGRAGRSAYSASKWGLRGITKSAAIEAGPFNVNINCVAPGMVDGDRFRTKVIPQVMEAHGLDEAAAVDWHARDYALRRISTAEDVANACLFLASDVSRQITGVDLPVDGGWAAL